MKEQIAPNSMDDVIKSRRKHGDLIWFRRMIWGLAGISIFFWIGYEDQGLLAVTLIASLLALAIAVEVFNRWERAHPGGGATSMLHSTVVGMLFGALVGPIAVLLALIKLSLHQHSVPDFTINDLGLLIQSSLGWSLVGALMGMGGGLIFLSRKKPKEWEINS
ncbi:MAG: hypothetical protein GTO18_07035 [Anaerolineales bacterium]|nr:hypothetical protein [Anaerolineales bacterium]